MKYLLLISSLFVICLYGCGNDTTNNSNSTGGETVIFSMDSLSINLTSSIEVKDTLFYVSNAPNIKISFNCTTNADSINGFASYQIVAGDSNMVYLDSVNSNNSLLNGDHFININASSYFALTILIQLSRDNANPYFLRLRNIKVFKL
ncbi:MAG: hypothetical protein ABI543_13165 [Ignavibacteria bacterium]